MCISRFWGAFLAEKIRQNSQAHLRGVALMELYSAPDEGHNGFPVNFL